MKMKLESKRVKLFVQEGESKRLDKWAETMNGTIVDTVIHMGKMSFKIEKTYKFPSIQEKERFLAGLKPNFGESVRRP